VCVNPDQPEVLFNLDWATTEGSGCFLGLLLFGLHYLLLWVIDNIIHTSGGHCAIGPSILDTSYKVTHPILLG
jgi:hypothetical protein